MGELRTHYTDEQKETAVRCYLAGGSYAKAEALSGVKKEAIALWKHRNPEWWEEMVQKISAEMEQETQSGWRRVLGKALNVMEDRLENGNHQLIQFKGADGKVETRLERVPVPAKDAVVIGGIAADKLRVSMGLPNRITGKVEDNDRLEELRKLAEASRAARKGTDTLVESKAIN